METFEEKDLTGEDGPLKPNTYDQLVPQGPVVEFFNLDKEQEKVRGIIAQGLVVLLAVLVLFAFITLWAFSSTFADLEKLMTVVFGPVIALVGTAIGYYFGGKNASGDLSESGK